MQQALLAAYQNRAADPQAARAGLLAP